MAADVPANGKLDCDDAVRRRVVVVVVCLRTAVGLRTGDVDLSAALVKNKSVQLIWDF